MDIRNATQFAAFLSGNQLVELDPLFVQLIKCFNDFSRHCNCHRQKDKERIYQNCNKLYVQGAMIGAIRFKNEFLNKTTERNISFFSENGTLIAIASR